MALTDIFLGFSAGISLMLSLLLFTGFTGANRRANIWLALFFLFLCTVFSQALIEAFGLTDHARLFVHLLELPRWAILPCFYMAIRYFVNPAELGRYNWVHFIPVTIFVLFSFLFFIPRHFDPGHDVPSFPPWVGKGVAMFFLLQSGVYWLLSLFRLIRHSRDLKLIVSSVEEVDLAWLRYVLLAALVLVSARLFERSNPGLSVITPVLYMAALLLMGYYSLKQKIVYAVPPKQNAELGAIIAKKEPVARLTSEQVAILKSKLLEVMDREKLHLDPGLTLPVLAERMNMNTHELSYTINSGFSKNFYVFVNELRVDEAKRLIASGETRHLDMLGIATHAGFNSKTTFNTTFKKITGLTPTEYLKQV